MGWVASGRISQRLYVRVHLGGDVSSCNRVGWYYEVNVGVGRDMEHSVKWYQLAADKGHPMAQNWLGNQDFNGSH